MRANLPMIGLLQRVTRAEVVVAGETIGSIGEGLMVLIGVERGDGETQARRLADRLLGYRMFADADRKMNLSVVDIDGGVLLVPQFTLAADLRKGNRPSFIRAAPPELAEPLYEHFCTRLREAGLEVATGRFGARMAVRLTNDGPVTFTLRVAPEA